MSTEVPRSKDDATSFDLPIIDPEVLAEMIEEAAEQPGALSRYNVVLGGSGLVGSHFTENTENALGIPSSLLDIRDRNAVMRALELCAGGRLINFAAYTNVDQAQNQKGDKVGEAWLLNVEAARMVAEACERHGIHLVHLSTGFVFEGSADNPGPNAEDAEPATDPEKVSWYAWTKRQGELAVLEACPSATILRIDYPFRGDKHDKTDFARGMLDAYRAGKLLSRFNDNQLTPTYILDVKRAFDAIMTRNYRGIAHVASPTSCSALQFAVRLIEEVEGHTPDISGSSMAEFLRTSTTPRPIRGGLDCTATQATLGISFHKWEEAIHDMVPVLKQVA